jgi:hypothetical protein
MPPQSYARFGVMLIGSLHDYTSDRTGAAAAAIVGMRENDAVRVAVAALADVRRRAIDGYDDALALDRVGARFRGERAIRRRQSR